MPIMNRSVVLSAPVAGTYPDAATWKSLGGLVVDSALQSGGSAVTKGVEAEVTVSPIIGTGTLTDTFAGPTHSFEAGFAAGRYAPLGAAAGNWAAPIGSGVIRWRVSRGGIMQTLYSDLRSGRYYFGSCDSVFAEVMRWDVAGSSAVDWSVDVGGAYATSDGAADYDDLTFTVLENVAAGVAVSKYCNVPPFARWWQPIAGGYAGLGDDSLWGSANPDLVFSVGQLGGAPGQVVYRWASNQLLPLRQRYELLYPGPYNMYVVTKASAVTVNSTLVGFRFFIRS